MQVTITRAEQPTVREIFDRAKPVMLDLQDRMTWGECSPEMFRSAVRRLSSMLEIAGRTGDFRCEAEIVDLLATSTDTLYH
jgi:hypothetical protein